MSHHHDIYCDSHPPYSFVYYAYKSKLYFLRNAMMRKFCSLVKIITTHLHADEYINRTKICFTRSIYHDLGYTSHLKNPGDNPNEHGIYLHTHRY